MGFSSPFWANITDENRITMVKILAKYLIFFYPIFDETADYDKTVDYLITQK
jgi:hypothetical protein